MEAGPLQVRIIEPEQRHSQCRVQHFRLDPVYLLILDPLDRVPAARPRRLVALFHVLAQLLAAAPGAEAASHRKWTDPRSGEDIAFAVRPFLDMWSTVAEFLIEPRFPEICRLHHV